jgi:endonuclease/exonuclease/phosphatase family metal-dependent hydrolase
MKLITLNVEGNRHLDRIVPFLEHEQPQVLSLQEVFEKDARYIADHLGMTVTFSAMALDTYDCRSEALEPIGIAILTINEPVSTHVAHYKNATSPVVSYAEGKDRHSLLWVEVGYKGSVYVVCTTHIMVTPDGLPTDEQRTDMTHLLKILDIIPEIILCGDFNIPRGINELYDQFATRYTDNIPKEVRSTIDINFHRAGDDPDARTHLVRYVVDYVFTTSGYQTTDVRIASGVSDHCAVAVELYCSLV